MDEAEIGEQAIVGACAFVRAGMKVPARWLASGLPARNQRELSEGEIAAKRAGTAIYQDLTRRCLATMSQVHPLAAVEPQRPRLPVPARWTRD